MKKILVAGASLLLSIAAYAVTPVLTVNGEVADKVPTRLTFDGDYVVVHFGDVSESYDIESVTVTFPTSGISDIEILQINGLVGNALHVSGVNPGTALNIYGLDGKLRLTQTSVDDNAVIDVAGLPAGVYMLQAGRKCVKFVKR